MDGFCTVTCRHGAQGYRSIKAPGRVRLGRTSILRADSLRGYSSVADTWTAFIGKCDASRGHRPSAVSSALRPVERGRVDLRNHRSVTGLRRPEPLVNGDDDLQLGDVLTAIGPSASIVFAAWIFMSFCRTDTRRHRAHRERPRNAGNAKGKTPRCQDQGSGAAVQAKVRADAAGDQPGPRGGDAAD